MERRLRARGTDDEDKIKQRLETAGEEIKHAEIDGFHDKIFVNDNLTEAFEELEKYIFQTDVAVADATGADSTGANATGADSTGADPAGAEDTPAAEEGEGEGASEAVSAKDGEDTTMAEGEGGLAEKE